MTLRKSVPCLLIFSRELLISRVLRKLATQSKMSDRRRRKVRIKDREAFREETEVKVSESLSNTADNTTCV